MSAVVEWTLDRPPNLDKDFPDDRANGERARDVWYERRRRPEDKTLPVVDLLASEEVQKQQRHERSMLWKKALRRYNNAQRDKNEEAERKRSARLLTNLRAGLGDAEAESRLDAEAERARRRRADAKERVQQLQNTIDTARALRAQQAVKAVAIQESVRWAVEQRERPRLPSLGSLPHKYSSHYHVLHSLAQAHYAAQHPPDGTTDWDAALEHAASQAEAESEAMRSALLDWDRLFDPDYVEPWPFDPFGYNEQLLNKPTPCTQPGVDGSAVEHRWAFAPVPLPSALLSCLQQELQQQLETCATLRPTTGAPLNDIDEDDCSGVERAACQDQEAAAAAGLSVGERVVVCGLQSDTGRAMNELQGVVVGWIAEKQRWEIHLDGAEAHKTINLKPKNARPLQPRPSPRQDEAEEGKAAEGEAEAQYQEPAYADLEQDGLGFDYFRMDDFGLDAEQGPTSGSGTDDEAACNEDSDSDLEWAMAEEPLPPPPSTVETEWWELSRAQKATARLLGFRSHNWHRKQAVITCLWAELCNEEQAAACSLGFDQAQWDTYAPERVPLPAKPTAAQFQTALQFVATQLKQTHDAVQQLCQVCMHPFNASREPPARLEPAAWEPDSLYFPAWCGLLYDVHSVRQTVMMPPFVRPLASRRSAQNPDGYCREHCCTFPTPINVHRVHPNLTSWWENNCCDCAIGAPGLQPCSICGKGLSGSSDMLCYQDVCCEVVRFYKSLCRQLEDGLPKADRAQERERQRKLAQLTGSHCYYSLQESHLELRMRGVNRHASRDEDSRLPMIARLTKILES